MEVECPKCEEICEADDSDLLLSEVRIFFECYNCHHRFERVYKYSHTDDSDISTGD